MQKTAQKKRVRHCQPNVGDKCEQNLLGGSYLVQNLLEDNPSVPLQRDVFGHRRTGLV
ncbi:hypothetical protein BH18ACI2_BH18ACI2_05750 [soil metagenome]|jgi:hypothetical protein